LEPNCLRSSAGVESNILTSGLATSGRDSGVVGYNVQVAVDTKYHLIVVHDVINVGNDRA
jgi:hypothetical protein